MSKEITWVLRRLWGLLIERCFLGSLGCSVLNTSLGVGLVDTSDSEKRDRIFDPHVTNEIAADGNYLPVYAGVRIDLGQA